MARVAALLHLVACPSARAVGFAGFALALSLAGCAQNNVYDQLRTATPVGDPFSLAQYRDYSYLARSFGTQDAPPGQAFDGPDSIALTGADNTVSGVANDYAKKALTAAQGDEVLPEQAPDGDADADNVRFELLRDLDEGRDKLPDDAARAQADYDCWVMNRRVPELTAAARACRRSVTRSLAKLERELSATAPDSSAAPNPAPSESSSPASEPAPTPVPPAPAPSAASAPATPAPASAQQQNPQFTVYFPARSAKLSPDEFTMVAQAIAAARSGRQSHISVIGYTDHAEASSALSLRRADAVEAALVEMGARPEAISVSGAKGDDEAGEGKEARRAVITLIP